MKITIATVLAVCTTLVYASAIPKAVVQRDAADMPNNRPCSFKGIKCVRARAIEEVYEIDGQSAIDHASALADDDDEDYDTRPDGIDEETYQADLTAKDAEDNELPPSKREAEPRIPNNSCGPVTTWKDYYKCPPL